MSTIIMSYYKLQLLSKIFGDLELGFFGKFNNNRICRRTNIFNSRIKYSTNNLWNL